MYEDQTKGYSLPSLVHYVLCFFSLSDILVHEGYSLQIIISKSLYVVVKFCSSDLALIFIGQ